MQLIRAVKAALDSEPDGFKNRILLWTGSDIHIVESWGEVRSVVKHPGQLAFQAVAIPLGEWHAETVKLTSDEATRVDPQRLEDLAERRRIRFGNN
jgi:hypothetical protein